MNTPTPPAGRVSGTRLATMLGDWRRSGVRQGAADLAAAIELQVRDGQLPPGTQLPAEREMARALGIGRTLVGAALENLRAAGLTTSRKGAGSWITSPTGARREPALSGRGELIDLARAAPSATAGLLEAVDAARQRFPGELGSHGYNELGLPALRERIAARYTDRGLPTTPAQVMITNGAHHGFVLALRMLAGPGDRVLVEQPTYPNALEAIRAAHAICVPVGVASGWDMAGIGAALRQAAPRLAYLIVDFQNPTGFRLDDEGRARLGSILRKARTPVVVDETFVELDLEGDPTQGPAPLAVSAGDLAITIGSAAKSHWGGLRIGWIRASEELLGRLVSSRFGVDLGSPVFEQLVLAELLVDQDSASRRQRESVRGMRDALVDALGQYCPEWTFRVPQGGLSLWCRLPEPMSTQLAVAAANHGVQIAPGSRFGAHGGLERMLRLPFALSADRLYEAVRRLSMAAESVRSGAGITGWPDVPVA